MLFSNLENDVGGKEDQKPEQSDEEIRQEGKPRPFRHLSFLPLFFHIIPIVSPKGPREETGHIGEAIGDPIKIAFVEKIAEESEGQHQSQIGEGSVDGVQDLGLRDQEEDDQEDCERQENAHP